jgi:hypothetical protein
MLFRDYLLDRLQFPAGDFREQYLDQLGKRWRDLLPLASKPIEYSKETRGVVFPEDHGFKEYIERDGRLLPTRFNLIDMLMLECDIRHKRKYRTLPPSQTSISATDMAGFTYCPVGWAISKTFKLPKQMSAAVGTACHEKHKLEHFVRTPQVDGEYTQAERNLSGYTSELDCDAGAKALFRDLADSVPVFVGTSCDGEERKWFTGRDGRYVGQPDYIFFNRKTKRHFVVEEKFQMIRKPARRDLSAVWCATHGYDPDAIDRERQRAVFFRNHLNQLRSYVYGIPDYGPLYGYLVYWRYWLRDSYMRDDEPSSAVQIEQARVRKISGCNDADRNEIKGVYRQITTAMREGGGEFDASCRSPAKCAGCVQSVLCGHKTGRFDRYTFPYDRKYLRTQRVPFPEELRKEKPLKVAADAGKKEPEAGTTMLSKKDDGQHEYPMCA